MMREISVTTAEKVEERRGYGCRQTEKGEGERGMKVQKTGWYHPFSPSKQVGIDHTPQTCLREMSQSCQGVNSLREKEPKYKNTISVKGF